MIGAQLLPRPRPPKPVEAPPRCHHSAAPDTPGSAREHLPPSEFVILSRRATSGVPNNNPAPYKWVSGYNHILKGVYLVGAHLATGTKKRIYMYVHQHLQVGVPYMVAATFANFHQLCPEKTAKPVCREKKGTCLYVFQAVSSWWHQETTKVT